MYKLQSLTVVEVIITVDGISTVVDTDLNGLVVVDVLLVIRLVVNDSVIEVTMVAVVGGRTELGVTGTLTLVVVVETNLELEAGVVFTVDETTVGIVVTTVVGVFVVTVTGGVLTITEVAGVVVL